MIRRDGRTVCNKTHPTKFHRKNLVKRPKICCKPHKQWFRGEHVTMILEWLTFTGLGSYWECFGMFQGWNKSEIPKEEKWREKWCHIVTVNYSQTYTLCYRKYYPKDLAVHWNGRRTHKILKKREKYLWKYNYVQRHKHFFQWSLKIKEILTNIYSKLELKLSGNPTGRSPSSPEKKFLRCVECKVIRKMSWAMSLSIKIERDWLFNDQIT